MSTPKPESKKARMLRFFVAGTSLNTFEAEPLGDHCLNSTVSTLSNNYGLEFHRQWETVPSRFSKSTRVVRYRLAESSMDTAHTLLLRWCDKQECRQPRGTT